MNKQLSTDSIVHGDNVNVMKAFPDDCIDLCITSPPYDSLRDYDGYEFNMDTVAPELFRVVKPGGVVVWIVADGTKDRAKTGTSIRQFQTIVDAGFSIHDWMIFKKKGVRYPDSKRYYSAFEFMPVFSKGVPKTINQIADRKNKTAGTRRRYSRRERDGSITPMKNHVGTKSYGVRTNVWEYSTGSSCNAPDKLAYEHPAIMPLALAEDHVISWSNQGDIVLDICSGSGQVPIAAMIRGRRYIGIDCSQRYVEIARQRLANYQQALDADTMQAILKHDDLRCQQAA